MWQRRWRRYDPTWLIEVAEKHAEDYPWLPEALQQCTRASLEGPYYIRFVSPRKPNQKGSKWQFKECISLETDQHGELMIDILEGDRVGGIEFISKLISNGSVR